MLQRPQQRRQTLFEVMEIDDEAAAVEFLVLPGDRHRHAPVVPVQGLKRSATQAKLVQRVEPTFDSDVKAHAGR